MGGDVVADRVVVFLDYQNVYMGARACFHSRIEPHWCGQIDPLKLGLHLAADSPFDREHVGVRAYRGLPDGTFDPKGFGACTRCPGSFRSAGSWPSISTRTTPRPGVRRHTTR